MNFYSILLSTLFILANGNNVDRLCGQNLENLWLDIAIVVDNSIGMTHDGLVQVAANIATVFANGTRIGTGYADPRSTRVGLVTYSKTAAVAGYLDQYQSYEDLLEGVFTNLAQVDNYQESYLATGLNAALDMLNNGSSILRPNYKKLIIVYASAYQGEGQLDPLPTSRRVKESDIEIATVAFVQGGADTLTKQLCLIATPGFCFTSSSQDGGNLVGELQGAALQVNCFCPSLWTQYRTNYQDVFSYRYGVCNKGSEILSNWIASKFACQNLIDKAYLATEFSQHKHDYIFEIAQNITAYSQPYGYHIGLNYVNGDWYWQQPIGLPQLRLDNDTTFWNPGYPKSISTNTGVQNMQSSSDLSVGWQNVSPMTVAQYYMCEVASCDTDKYCP